MNVNMFKAGDNVHDYDDQSLERTLPAVEELRLPPDFAWGTATAAYQIEGAAFEDGKGKSIWDTFTHLEPSRTNGENADVTCDHYRLMEEDVELMASYGVDVYRFSIAWTRIIPLGGRNDPINEKGIAFYNRLIDYLLKKHIVPVATLYHWDAPQGIYDRYGTFFNTAEFQADFEHYARLCFSRFGDRVKKWITFNEPYIISIFGHHSGLLAPGRSTATEGDSRTEPWRVGHTLILAHTAAVRAYATDFQSTQNGSISIVLNGHWYEPWDATSEIHRLAAQRRLEFYIGWFGDPIFLGKDYPTSMRAQLGSRLPEFTSEELELLRQSAPINSFYGMNHYTTKYARALPDPPADDDCTGNVEEGPINSEGKFSGPVTGMSWLRVTPAGFRKLLNWVWHRYQRPIIVTENGCPCPGESEMTLEQALDDQFRIRYFGLYLDAISHAIYKDGVMVEGYYVWSLMDNFGMSTLPQMSTRV
jgi:beta-glucosidase